MKGSTQIKNVGDRGAEENIWPESSKVAACWRKIAECRNS
jgi:hypothetical protein